MSAMLLGFGAVGLAATVIAGRMAGEKLSPFSNVALVLIAVLYLGTFIRPVGAEDDCNYSVTYVVRLPAIGLVCVGE